jgi:hypothetical protein
MAGADGPPVELIHRSCGHSIVPTLTCPGCSEPIDPRHMEALPGPALRGKWRRRKAQPPAASRERRHRETRMEGVRGGRITAIRADETNPITAGYICNKAFSLEHYVEHGQRVEHPLRRRADGSFERIGWPQAINEIATRLSAIRRDHSPRAIGLVGIGGQGNHMDAPYGLGFLRALGSRRWFNAFAQEKTQHALLDQWMFDASPDRAQTDSREPQRERVTLPRSGANTSRRPRREGSSPRSPLRRTAGDPAAPR